MLRQHGLALGGSLDNAIVLGETGVLNNALRFEDEFVRHKILDVLGDLALVGHPIIGHWSPTAAATRCTPRSPRGFSKRPTRGGWSSLPASRSAVCRPVASTAARSANCSRQVRARAATVGPRPSCGSA